MATAVQKIVLSSSRDIPFNKLVLNQSNARRIKAGVSSEDLAALIPPMPCVVRERNGVILAEEVSLAENIERAPLHPLDQF